MRWTSRGQNSAAGRLLRGVRPDIEKGLFRAGRVGNHLKSGARNGGWKPIRLAIWEKWKAYEGFEICDGRVKFGHTSGAL